MPIKPENRGRYPRDWKTRIVPAVRERAGNCCELCGIGNGLVGVRLTSGEFRRVTGVKPGDRWPNATGWKVFAVVCTVAHWLDKRPEACDLDNLRFLCQRCHNRHDAADRAKNAAATRKASAT